MRAFIAANDPVPVVRTQPLHLPLDLHGKLMSEYLKAQAADGELRFQQWLVGELRERIGRTVSGS